MVPQPYMRVVEESLPELRAVAAEYLPGVISSPHDDAINPLAGSEYLHALTCGVAVAVHVRPS
jgi:hypothetical protein